MDRRRFVVLLGAAGIAPGGGCLGRDDPPDEPAYGDWFDNVRNFEGFVDRTDRDPVTVLVGTGDRGWQFDPAAVSVAPGTTVVWEWTGRGGDHNVEHRDTDWENPGGTVAEEGHTWEREFTEPGTHLYTCWPHDGLGMRGGVFVDAHAQ